MRRLLFLALLMVAARVSSGAEDAKFFAVDLQPYITQKREDGLGSGIEGNNLANVPGGEQTFGGIVFTVGDGIIHLGSNIIDRHPEKVEGIKVNATCSKLHILHATCFGGGPNKPGDPFYIKDGTPIGQYMVR